MYIFRYTKLLKTEDTAFLKNTDGDVLQNIMQVLDQRGHGSATISATYLQCVMELASGYF